MAYQYQNWESVHSKIHCIGENFQNDSWKYTSCHVQNLCIPPPTAASSRDELVVFPSQQETKLEELLSRHPYAYVSTTNRNVSLGSLETVGDGTLLPWAPISMETNIDTASSPKMRIRHFLSDTSTVWIPYYSFSDDDTDLESILWKDLFPIYTLLSSFGLQDSETILLTDMRAETTKKSPIFPSLQRSLHELVAAESLDAQGDSYYSCAIQAVYGIGMLATTHNIDLIPLVSQFYSFLEQHVLDMTKLQKLEKEPNIILLIHVSLNNPSSSATKKEPSLVALFRQRFPQHEVQYVPDTMQLSLEEMYYLARSSRIVILCGADGSSDHADGDSNYRHLTARVLLSLVRRDTLILDTTTIPSSRNHLQIITKSFWESLAVSGYVRYQPVTDKNVGKIAELYLSKEMPAV